MDPENERRYYVTSLVGSGNGLLPDGTKPLPDDIGYLKFYLDLSGANELKAVHIFTF